MNLDLLFLYQRLGVSLGIEKGGTVILADDMGLGKSVQGIALIEHFRKDPVLIICQAGLILNLKDEIELWSPELAKRVHPVTESTGRRAFKPDPDVINIMSFGRAARLWEKLARYAPRTVLVDESQGLKDKDSNQSKRLIPIISRADVRILLSGTPMDRPIDLYGQLKAVGLPGLPGYWQYGFKFCAGKKKIIGCYIDPNTKKKKFKKVCDFSGESNQEQLNKLIQPVLIRRLKKDVEHELPEKRRRAIHVSKEHTIEAEEKVRKMVRAVLAQTKNNPKTALNVIKKHRLEVEAGVLEAYRQVGLAKVDVACERIADWTSRQSPLVVFAHNRDVIVPIWQYIKKKTDLRVGVISGRVERTDQHELKRKFQAGDLDLLILSTMAGYAGHTLTAAWNVLMVQIPWLATIALQCEDRVHRINQKNAVLISYLVAVGSFDENLWRSVAKKAENINRILDGGNGVSFEADETEHVGGDWSKLITDIVIEEASRNGSNSEKRERRSVGDFPRMEVAETGGG